ncbi:hypothetical protein LRR81_07175 [Metabacillus sp. GX 13764]|uniref:hypothetical protein n=1 Tax=Metabacillus kandeliae TaxID=2900151 RepID=UPI001E51AD9C|nr:hypothetical protein [Metabacillus kandeliae]MCD7034015.1 hypothetical protein [Metabacillus kandeliae]
MSKKATAAVIAVSASLLLGGCGMLPRLVPQQTASESSTKTNEAVIQDDSKSLEESADSSTNTDEGSSGTSEDSSTNIDEGSSGTSEDSGTTGDSGLSEGTETQEPDQADPSPEPAAPGGSGEMPARDVLLGSGGTGGLEELASKPEAKVPANVKKEVLSMLKKNLDTFNKEDLEGYMSTLSKNPEGFDRESERQLLEDTFAQADIKSTLLTSKIIEYEKNTVTVYAECKVKVSAPAAMASQKISKSLNVFTKDPEGWRMSASMMIDTGKME